jgi:hypothetical protein
MPRLSMPPPVVALLIGAPVLLVIATAWMANALVPACTIAEHRRLTSPDGATDLVTYSARCASDTPNTRATLVVAGQPVAPENPGFAAVAAETDLAPQWTGDRAVSLTLPDNVAVFAHADSVAEVAITYR